MTPFWVNTPEKGWLPGVGHGLHRVEVVDDGGPKVRIWRAGAKRARLVPRRRWNETMKVEDKGQGFECIAGSLRTQKEKKHGKVKSGPSCRIA